MRLSDDFGALLAGFERTGEDHPLWTEPAAPALQIEEVERIWSAIASNDDWSALHQKVAEIRRLGQALGSILPPD